MTFSLHPGAEKDVAQAIDFYSKQAGPKVAARFLEEFERVANLLLENPRFGPVLQVVRWTGEPGDVIAQINALAYGLTLGIQTRIDSRAQALAHAALLAAQH